jgi:hypothetical protein
VVVTEGESPLLGCWLFLGGRSAVDGEDENLVGGFVDLSLVRVAVLEGSNPRRCGVVVGWPAG